MQSFWNQLRKPFFAMAPMADVTDAAFRKLFLKRGAPDIFWTEFVSADGLYHTREVKKMKAKSGKVGSPDAVAAFRDEENPLMGILAKSAEERPIVAQIFSAKPEMISYAAKLVEELGFDGVDLNMGCPDRAVERQGAGAALVKDPKLAAELIRAAQQATRLPVSVKTRVGYSREALDEWLTALLMENPAAITLHLRTRNEMSLVPADWELMKKAVEIRNRVNPKVLLIGNGDVRDLEDARKKISESGCDGAMLGRSMFGNPWIFAGRKPEDTPLAEKLAALIELAEDFEKLVPRRNFAILKKHIKAFVAGFDGAAELRARLMAVENSASLAATIAEYEKGR